MQWFVHVGSLKSCATFSRGVPWSKKVRGGNGSSRTKVHKNSLLIVLILLRGREISQQTSELLLRIGRGRCKASGKLRRGGRSGLFSCLFGPLLRLDCRRDGCMCCGPGRGSTCLSRSSRLRIGGCCRSWWRRIQQGQSLLQRQSSSSRRWHGGTGSWRSRSNGGSSGRMDRHCRRFLFVLLPLQRQRLLLLLLFVLDLL